MDWQQLIGMFTTLLNRAKTTIQTQIQDIYTRLRNLQSMYLFLSLWDCTTGLPYDDPREEEYEYKRGMFYIVADTAAANTKAVQAALKKAQGKPTKANIDTLTKEIKKSSKETNDVINYRPTGTSYVPGVPSTEQELQNVKPGDKYWYTGVSWQLMMNTGGEVAWENIVGEDPKQNTALKGVLDGKVDKPTVASMIPGTDTQGSMSELSYSASALAADYLVQRGPGGHIYVPANPSNGQHAASKSYADQMLKMPTSGTQGGIQAVKWIDEDGVEIVLNLIYKAN